MAERETMKMAWHYTVGEYIPEILATGVLLQADIGMLPGEKPIVWFSTNQIWDNTANKAVIDDKGKRHALDMEHTAHYGQGLYRFGMPSEKLIKWPELAKAANMKAKMRDALAKTGRFSGARPDDEWYGSIEPVPISGLLVQVMKWPEKEWIDFDVEAILAGA